MKLVAFSCGRKNGNTEIYIKEALMEAEKKGLEVELICLSEYELHNCNVCSNGRFCVAMDDIKFCPHKDDAEFLANKFLDADGVIFGSPVYSLTANSLFFAFRDRVFGPKMDIALSKVGMKEPEYIKGRHKARPAGLISVGGAVSKHCLSFGLASLYTATLSPQTEVVDTIDVFGIADMNAAAANEEWLEKARKLGEHVADAILTGNHEWRGEEEGVCPSCHLNNITVKPNSNEVNCPVCGIKGELSLKDGKTHIEWPNKKEYREINMLTEAGKVIHLKEILHVVEEYSKVKEKAKEVSKKYTEYNDCVVPSPIKEAKKAALREKYMKK